jgi:sugar/nucleoside kinase (ribokinase family)
LSFDPSSEGAIETLGRDRLLSALKQGGVGLLLPNIVEAVALTGQEDPAAAAVMLGDTAHAVVVKCGDRGAVTFAGDEAHQVPTEPILPLDTTGAGDAFNAGLLSALMRGDELENACSHGHVVAREAIQIYGGRPARRG